MDAFMHTHHQIEARPIEALVPYAKNPKNHGEEQLSKIVASLREFGWTFPILVDETGEVIAGHGRLLAAQRVLKYGWSIPGWEDIATAPVLVKQSLSESQKKAYRILDNKVAEESGWDQDLLALELESLVDSNFDIALTGFSKSDLDSLLSIGKTDRTEGLVDEDALPETRQHIITKPGDLWILGNHRLLCGDSTDAEQVSRLMNGERANLFSTDPPYLVDYDGTNHPGKKSTANKDWSGDYVEQEHWDASSKGQSFFEAFINVAIAHAVKDDVAWYCWHASKRQSMLEAAWEKAGAFVHQQIIWVKSRPVLTHSVLLWAHEPCLFGWIKGKKPKINREGFDKWPTTVWDISSKEIETREHPTSKPVRVFSLPMELHTSPGDVCYEPFSGSGSQIIAGERTGRRVFAMEMSPRFCDLAVRRWQEFTGERATLESDGSLFG